MSTIRNRIKHIYLQQLNRTFNALFNDFPIELIVDNSEIYDAWKKLVNWIGETAEETVNELQGE